MSNYDGIGSHSQTQSNSSPNAQTVDMDGLNDQVSGDRLENVEHYFEDNIDVELEGGDEEEDIVGDSKKRKKRVVTSRSPWWDHYTKFQCEKDNVQKARCKYCGREIKADPKAHGTRPLKNHYESCKKKPQEITRNQNQLSFVPTRMGDRDAPLVNWRFDQDKTREALCHMVFSITVDNASSNDGAIAYLKKKFDNWGQNILGGRYVHMRCMAHIVNLVVQDGLKGKDEHEAISRIRGAIRYIRNSPARYKKFQECVEFEKLETKKLLSLDVPTRWNSTYLMLETAISLKRAFDAYEDVDLAYKNDLLRQPFDGIPTDYDWERAKVLVTFLRHFYNLTLRISGALYVTSNLVFREICEVELLLRHWLSSSDVELNEMARKMKEKYDKYWGSIERINMILYYAVILDPRHKLEFLEFTFDKLYGGTEKCDVMKEQVRDGLHELFNDYKLRYGILSKERQEARDHHSVVFLPHLPLQLDIYAIPGS
ncbi:UNVERIFIED_CONTAM: hypothetical protein Sradi_2128900 [Sesamum radiatum]|uniref:BED-type domain-containing protein n=1 Tax=Sesamum radiatum TaxID=300843 RepID=A0AAW2TMH9_SESRA